MCGQFEALLYLKWLKTQLHLTGAEALEDPLTPQVIRPTMGAPVVLANPDHGGFEVALMRFGLVPHWYRGAFRDWKATTFNARIEDIADKPAYKGAYKYRRAIVPAEAFYEWSGPKTARTKWRITRADNQPLAFAGLWDMAHCREGEILSFTILTRDAGPDMAAIHAREPVVIGPDHWEDWMRMSPVDLTAPTALRLRMAEAPADIAPTLF